MTGDSGADRKGGPIRRFMQRMQQKNPSTSWSLADCKAVLSTHPDDVEALHECGVKLARNGCLPEAVDAFERILTLDDAHKESYNNLANIALERGNLDVAEQLYRAALSIDPDYCIALENLALVYRRRGDREAYVSTMRESARRQRGLHRMVRWIVG